MSAPLDKEVAVVFTEALAFGLYCPTFLVALRWLLCADEGWKLRKNIRWPVVIVASLIFGCNTFRLGWSLHWEMVAVWHAVNDPLGTPAYEIPEYANIVSCVVSNSAFLLADVALVARCWIVYGWRNLLVIIPLVLLWLVAFVCMVLELYFEVGHIHNPKIGPYSWAAEVNMVKGPGVVLVPFWISINLLNAYASGALIYRIHRTAKQCKPLGSSEHLHFVIRLIGETGALYFPITLAHLFLWFLTDNFALEIANTINAPILGITSNWFIIRVARSRVTRATKDVSGVVSTLKFRGFRIPRETTFSAMGYASDSAFPETEINTVKEKGSREDC